MKIAFVFDDSLDKNDGIQQYIFSLATWLIAQGHEVHYLVGQTKRTDLPHMYSLSRNINVTFNGNHLSIPLFGSRRKIRQVLAEQNYDVLHIQMPYHPYMAGWVIKLAGPRTMVFGTFHIAPFSKFVTFAARIQALLSRSSQKRFNKMVSVSPAAAQMAAQVYGITTEVLPNVFDYNRFHKAQPLAQYDDNVKTILFLGRLVERKGCLILLKAIHELQQSGSSLPPYRVLICGGGSLESSLKEYVNNQGLGDIVTFVGRVSEADKPRYYASADISVFPSSGGESFGIVLIEAMASGRAAVLGGDNPGYRSVLGTQPDHLFDPKDAAQLTRKLTTLLSDEPARRAAATWGMRESAQYEVSKVGAVLVKEYQSFAPDGNSE